MLIRNKDGWTAGLSDPVGGTVDDDGKFTRTSYVASRWSFHARFIGKRETRDIFGITNLEVSADPDGRVFAKAQGGWTHIPDVVIRRSSS